MHLWALRSLPCSLEDRVGDGLEWRRSASCGGASGSEDTEAGRVCLINVMERDGLCAHAEETKARDRRRDGRQKRDLALAGGETEESARRRGCFEFADSAAANMRCQRHDMKASMRCADVAAPSREVRTPKAASATEGGATDATRGKGLMASPVGAFPFLLSPPASACM